MRKILFVVVLLALAAAADFSRVPGNLQQVAAGAANNVWGLSGDGKIYRWNGRTFDNVPGNLSFISAGADGAAFALNGEGLIYRWTGSSFQPVDGRMQRLAVGSQKVVWGLDKDGFLNAFNGTGWTLVDNQSKFSDISGGPDGTLWALANDHRVFRFNPQDPTHWIEIPNKMNCIAVGSATIVWALDSQGALYRWDGNAFVSMPGNLASISAASDGSLWGLDGQGTIYSGR